MKRCNWPATYARLASGTFLVLWALVAVSRGAGAQISVVGNAVDEHNAHPGEEYVGSVMLRNLTSTAQPVRVYLTDYTFLSDGTSRYDPPGSLPRSNASWITPSRGSVIIPPMGVVTVAYTVKVPMTDTLRGTYWSALMFEGAVNFPRQAGGKQIAVGSIVRYAVQVASHLPESGVAKAIFENERLERMGADSGQALEVDLRNAGERGFRPRVWVEVYDSTGALRTRLQQQRGLLYPGTSIKQRFPLGNLARGTYKAVVFADIHEDAVTAAQYTLRY